MKLVSFAVMFASLLLAGCSDGRTAMQKTFENDVLEYTKAVWAGHDMTRKSAEAAQVAEKKIAELKGRKIEKWICIKRGGTCESINKKFDYHISLYPDQYISFDAYEGDKITFTGEITRIDPSIGSGATVWVVINSKADAVVTAK